MAMRAARSAAILGIAEDIEDKCRNKNVIGKLGQRTCIQGETRTGQISDDHQAEDRHKDVDENGKQL